MKEQPHVTKYLAILFAALVVLAAGCGSGSQTAPPPTRETAGAAEGVTQQPPVPPTQPAAPAVNSGAPTLDSCRAWLQEQSSLDYPQHGCAEYADILQAAARGGAAIVPLDNSRFFITRFPDNWETQPDRKLIVTLHGSGGCVERLYQWWNRPAADNGYALVALQYAWQDETAEEGYAFADAEQIYADLRAIFAEMPAYCPLNDTAVIYHGFSRGSARSFKVALLDRAADGMQLFSAFLADSGTDLADNNGQVPDYLENAAADAYSGANFWLYCGGNDHDGQTCEDMKRVGPLLEEHGATVDTYRYAPGGHGVFSTVRPGGQPSEALNAMLTYINSVKP